MEGREEGKSLWLKEDTRSGPQPFVIDISQSLIYKIRTSPSVRDNVEHLRRRKRLFVYLLSLYLFVPTQNCFSAKSGPSLKRKGLWKPFYTSSETNSPYLFPTTTGDDPSPVPTPISSYVSWKGGVSFLSTLGFTVITVQLVILKWVPVISNLKYITVCVIYS